VRQRAWRGRRPATTIAGLLCAAGLPGVGLADEESVFRTVGAPLQAYEPNLIGYTRATGDASFVDFTLSVKYPLMPRLTQHWWSPDNRLFLAFSGRFAFYYDTRQSSPAIVKRLNPKVFYQHVFRAAAPDPPPTPGSDWLPRRIQEPRSYATFAYAHESNGQAVDTAAGYAEAVRSAQDPRYAIDYISRGWDYLELNGRHVLHENRDFRWSVNGSVKDFLGNGIFQGHPEEVRPWEVTTQGKPRSAVDGLTVRGKFEGVRPETFAISGTELSVAYTTGSRSVGRYSTVRVEAGIQAFEIPFVVWCSRGYMSDLARYYVNVRSCGVALAIAGF
jgi:hypothetical protein